MAVEPASGAVRAQGVVMDETILVIDDHHDYAETLALVLQLRGFRATAVSDPLAALAHVAQQPPDLILSDVQMPGLDGVSLARRIRELGYQVPIMLMSGEPIPPLDLPAVQVASKTIEMEALITLVERHFT